METILILKIIFIFVILIESYITDFVPHKLKKKTLILSLMQAFSGGVFLAIALLHILPISVMHYNHEFQPEKDNKFPLPYFFTFIGYSLILTIDNVIFDHHTMLRECIEND